MYPNSIGSKWEILPEDRSGESTFSGSSFSTKGANLLTRHKITREDRRYLHSSMQYIPSSDFLEVLERVRESAKSNPIFPIQRVRDQFGNVLVIVDGLFSELRGKYVVHEVLDFKGESCTIALPNEVATIIERVEHAGGKRITDQEFLSSSNN